MKSNYFLIGVILALLLIVGVTWTMAQTEVTQYHACVNNASGTIHMLKSPDETCNTNEELIVWDSSGVPGPPGISKAYATGIGDIRLTADDIDHWVDIMSLDLPTGFYISDLTMQVDLAYRVTDAFLECDYHAIAPDGTRYNMPSVKIGGGLTPTGGRGNFTSNWALYLTEPTEVIVTCQPWFMEPGIEEILITSTFWTAIQVDDVESQEP